MKGGKTNMTSHNQKQQDDQKGGVNPIVAGVTGAVVGAAAVGIAGAAVLANDDGRKQVEKAIDTAKDKVEEMKGNIEEKIASAQEKVNEAISSVKNSTQNVGNDTEQQFPTQLTRGGKIILFTIIA